MGMRPATAKYSIGYTQTSRVSTSTPRRRSSSHRTENSLHLAQPAFRPPHPTFLVCVLNIVILIVPNEKTFVNRDTETCLFANLISPFCPYGNRCCFGALLIKSLASNIDTRLVTCWRDRMLRPIQLQLFVVFEKHCERINFVIPRNQTIVIRNFPRRISL